MRKKKDGEILYMIKGDTNQPKVVFRKKHKTINHGN